MKLTKDDKELLRKVFREHIASLQAEQARDCGKHGESPWYAGEIEKTRELLNKLLQE